jgi:hypothetical protein
MMLLYWVSKLIPAVKYVEFLVRICIVPNVKSKREANYFIAEYCIKAKAELGGKSKKE